MSQLEIFDDPLDDRNHLVHRLVEPVIRVGGGRGSFDRWLEEVGDAEAGFGRFGKAGGRQNFGLDLGAIVACVWRHFLGK